MNSLKYFGRVILAIAEPTILSLLIIAMWHLPAVRIEWAPLFLLALPIFYLRLAVYRRIWSETPLHLLLLLFILLTAYNFVNAPYQRATYIEVLSRPLLGLWLYVYFVDQAQQVKSTRWLLVATLGLGAVLGFIALTATGWLPEKALILEPVMDAMPRVDYRATVPDMLLGFNPNEIAGALAWLTPFCYGIAIASLQTGEAHNTRSRVWGIVRLYAAIIFMMLFIALFLGQSRFAIGGVLLAMIGLSALLLRTWRWRGVAIAGIGVVILLQAALVLNVFTPQTDEGLSARDQRSVTQRVDIWDRSIRMMQDYPTTGVGMAMYRTAVASDAYFIPVYRDNNRILPHAHNEFLQMGADLGVGGLLLFATWYAAIAWMLWRTWRTGSRELQIMALATAAGLLAHAVYGMGDAVTLWDRFAFIFWWMLGLAGAAYILRERTPTS